MQSTSTLPASPHLARILSDCLSINAAHEHDTRYIRINLEADIEELKKDGYILRHKTNTCAFLQKESVRIELIPSNVPEHQGWAVGSIDGYQKLLGKMRDSTHFTEVVAQRREQHDLHAAMFVDDSGHHIQIVFRSNPFFRHVFN